MTFTEILRKRLLTIVGLIGLLITLMQNVVELSNIIDQYFWTIFLISYIFSISTLWEMKDKKPKQIGFSNKKEIYQKFIIKYKWIILISILFSIIGVWRIWLIRHSVEDNRLLIDPNSAISELSIIPINYYSLANSNPDNIELIDFKLNSKKTSYKFKREVLNLSEYDNNLNQSTTLDYYYLPQKDYDGGGDVITALRDFLKPECESCLNNDRIISALKRFTLSIDRTDLIKYFDNKNLLKTLPERRPDITRMLIPTGNEWKDLKENNYSDYEHILSWVRNCIGIPFPVFTFTIQNNSSNPLIIKEVQYNFISVDFVWAAVAGASVLKPVTTIVHGIDIKRPNDCNEWVNYSSNSSTIDIGLKKGLIGDYRNYCDHLHNEAKIYPPHVYPISRLISVPENQAVSFDLQIYIKSGIMDAEATILMSIELITSRGTIRTNEFIWETTALN